MDELTHTITATPPLLALGDRTLHQLPAGVDVPRYDRNAITPGIVHIGLGNFHRAHQAWYLHRLMQQGQALDWGILGAGVRSFDGEQRKKLLAQDCLTTLVELDPSGTSAEVTGAMIDYVEVAPNNAPLIAAIADPDIRIVSLTVTEGGYFTSPATGRLDVHDPDIEHDASHPDSPRTAFGAIVAGLGQRRRAGRGPITVMSCDNLRGNGDITRDAVVTLADLIDADLARWIDTNVSFPNAMVDCIVPATGARELAFAEAFGIHDAAPVTHENFRQWVIEDRFCAGRPPLEAVGVTFTDDVHAYEAMKIRMLNAGHQVLANLGELLSRDTISDCMADPLIRRFFETVETNEILPYVAAVPEMTPNDYLGLISKRFANPAIVDTVRRVAFDGSSRHPGFVVPIIEDALASGGTINGLALVEALWARMCAGTRQEGSVIDPNDPHWDTLTQTAQAAQLDPTAWVSQTQYYGEVGQNPRFRAAFAAHLEAIWHDGADAAVQNYLDAAR